MDSEVVKSPSLGSSTSTTIASSPRLLGSSAAAVDFLYLSPLNDVLMGLMADGR